MVPLYHIQLSCFETLFLKFVNNDNSTIGPKQLDSTLLILYFVYIHCLKNPVKRDIFLAAGRPKIQQNSFFAC